MISDFNVIHWEMLKNIRYDEKYIQDVKMGADLARHRITNKKMGFRLEWRYKIYKNGAVILSYIADEYFPTTQWKDFDMELLKYLVGKSFHKFTVEFQNRLKDKDALIPDFNQSDLEEMLAYLNG